MAEVAEKVGADAVVVGTGARRGPTGLLFGSSAERILTRVPCDVLAVHV
ncbi:MAG: universal stress protein [Pseudomonadales bacterium]